MASPRTIESVTIGGRVITDLANLKILWGAVDTAGRYTTFRNELGTGGYQASGGILRIVGMRLTGVLTGGTLSGSVGYGDTDVGVDSASAPTTPVYFFGRSATSTAMSENNILILDQADARSTGGLELELSMNHKVPDTKFPFFKASGVGSWGAYFYCVQE